jgi:superfamily I DNA/RNA helicase
MPQTISLELLWQETGFHPNDNQKAAILHTDGPLFLPAGPGSGKTRVLLWRTLNLIVFHEINPEEILEKVGAVAASRPEVFRAQIAQTIENHFTNQGWLKSRGVKVLSLFFIDRVNNYTAGNGLVKRLFDEEFNRLNGDGEAKLHLVRETKGTTKLDALQFPSDMKQGRSNARRNCLPC